MSNELQTVIDFCLEHASEAPVHRRVSLYRGLAEFCGDPHMAAEFCRMADDLEAADHACREFNFRFKNRPTKKRKHNGHHDGHGGHTK